MKEKRVRVQRLGHAVLKVRSLAVYCHDPDGIMIEVYFDADPTLWRDDPGAVAHMGR